MKRIPDLSGLGRPDRSLAVIVPMKPLSLAKQRLRPVLPDEARRALAHAMLTHVLATVAESEIADMAVLISADEQVLQLASTWGFHPLPENASGYNGSTAQAIAWAQQVGMDAVLVLPADLPDLQVADLHTLRSLIVDAPQAVILAPDDAESGTNALLLRPPDLISPSFGPDSFNRHCLLARAAGVEPAIYRSPSLAFDIDLPSDLDHLPVFAIS